MSLITGTSPHIAKFISSQVTGNSEIEQQIWSLGQLLAEQLAIDSSNDTLSRWMSAYLAEQMSLAEAADDDIKAVAEQNCFETILRLWEHRSHFPNGKRPFENYEKIFRVLEQIDPNYPAPFYYSGTLESESYGEVDSKPSEEGQSVLLAAKGVDLAARTFVTDLIQFAIAQVKDVKTEDWLQTAIGIGKHPDIDAITHIDWGLLDDDKDLSREKQKQIESKLRRLEMFLSYGNEMLKQLSTEFDTISKRISNSEDSESPETPSF